MELEKKIYRRCNWRPNGFECLAQEFHPKFSVTNRNKIFGKTFGALAQDHNTTVDIK